MTPDEKKAAELAALQKQLADLNATIVKAGAPSLAHITSEDNLGGRVGSYWQETDETANFQVANAAGAPRDALVNQDWTTQKRMVRSQLKSAGYVPRNEFKSFGDMIRYGVTNRGNPHLWADRWHRHVKTIQGMSETVGSDGGFAVVPEFATRILDRVFANQLFAKTDNYTVTGNNMTFLANAETSRATGSRAGGIEGYWFGEGATITKSKPTIREISMKLCNLGVVVYLTQQLIDDNSFALEQYVTRKASEEFNFMLGDAVIEGTGAGQPQGILNSPNLISISKEPGQTTATLQTENITKMSARLYAGSRGASEWYINQDVRPQLHTMTLGIGAAGVTTYMPPGGLSGLPYATLEGRPVNEVEFCSTLGTQGDVILADLGAMITISKGGIAQAVSMHIEFLTDQLAVRFIMRVNGQTWENSALTPFKGSNTQSSFVTLNARP